jgi:hypothetical protein
MIFTYLQSSDAPMSFSYDPNRPRHMEYQFIVPHNPHYYISYGGDDVLVLPQKGVK